MTTLNGLIEKKDSLGRVVERGTYRHGHRVGRIEIMDYDRGIVVLGQYSDDGTEQVQSSHMYAMVRDRKGNYIHRGDLLQSSQRNADGTTTVSCYEYHGGSRIPKVKQLVFKNGKLCRGKSHPGR